MSPEDFMRGLRLGGWLHIAGITGTTHRTLATVTTLHRRDRQWITTRPELWHRPMKAST